MLAVGQVAALAACHALSERLAAPGPVHVDVSAREAAIAAAGPFLQCGGLLLNAGGHTQTAPLGAPSGWFPCADGMIRISVLEDHQWARMVTALGAPDWTDGFEARSSWLEHSDQLSDHIREWSSQQAKADCEAVLQAHGVPACAMFTLAEARASAQFQWRDSWRTVRAAGRSFDIIEPQVPGGRGTAPAGQDPGAAPRGLRGLRVIEAGHVLAVPLAASILGTMGADVVKLEDPRRPDSYRTSGPFIAGHPDPEWSAYFSIVNYSKDSAVTEGPTDVRELTATASVILENWGTQRAERSGLSPDALRAGPGGLLVRLSGFGRSGPLAAYRAYAYNITAHSGMLSLITKDPGRPPVFDLTLADLAAAYSIATIVAAWALGREAEGTERLIDVDVSMEELLTERLNGLLEAADGEPGLPRVGRESGASTGHPGRGCRRPVRRGDLSGRGRPGRPAPVGAGRAPGPPPDQSATHSALASQPYWIHGEHRTAAEWLTALRGHGAVAERVLDAADLVADLALLEDGIFAEVVHPQWGTRRIVGLPWRFAGPGPISADRPAAAGAPRR